MRDDLDDDTSDGLEHLWEVGFWMFLTGFGFGLAAVASIVFLAARY